MTFAGLGSQFALELAFGVLVTLAFVPKAPVGVFFYRMMGGTVLVALLGAIALPVMAEDGRWTDPPLMAACVAALACPLYSGSARHTRFWVGLGVGLVASAAGVFFYVRESVEGGLGPQLLGTASALATGAVAGGVGLAMVLGHWYLTVPKLEVSHLARVNRVTAWAMVASLSLLVISILVFRSTLAEARTPLLGPWGLFYLGTRVAVGLVMPLLFAWMTAGSLRYQNTRSATGILYASTILVLIGAAVSLSLQDSYGVPL